MQPIEDDEKPDNSGRPEDSVTFVIPVKHPISRTESEHLFLRGDTGYGATATYADRVAHTSAITIYAPGNTVEETVENIASRSEVDADEDLTKVAECAAFWRSVGADTAIYICSLGASVAANGLIIRFTGINPLVSTLLIPGVGALAYNNAQILFTSLINPPTDDIPGDGKKSYALINKYAMLPFSFVIKAGVTGSILSALGDTNFGTQQAVSAGTSPVIGPAMTAIRMGIRKCYKGSYVLAPETPDVGQSFKKAYSHAPNPIDQNRPYRYGTARDMFAKLFGVTASTLMLSYSGGFKIENYCIPMGEAPLTPWNSTLNQTDPFLNQTGAFPDNCYGGNLTFMFRELGISFGYAVGFLIVEPVLAAVTNRIFDYFYPVDEAEDDISLEEIDGENGNDDNSV